MLKLKELRFSGIGRFIEEQKISFSNLSNLVQVDGQNNNTNGSSGSGKTTIFNALDYLFGLNDVPNTVLQSRLTKDGISVTGLFDMDGQNLKISRIKGKLAVDLDGDLTTGSSKLSEERLDQILAMPRHLFRPLYHKRQKEGGFFLQFTPKDMNEFLMDCLGLGDYRLKLDIIDKKLKNLAFSKSMYESDQYGNELALQATQKAIASLGQPPIREITREMIVGLKSKSDTSLEALKALEALHEAATSSLDRERPNVQFPPFDTTRLEMYQNSVKELQEQLSNRLMAERDRQSKVKNDISEKKSLHNQLSQQIYDGVTAKEEAKKIALQVQKIRENVCPTCDQGWNTESAKTTETQLLAKLSICKEKISQGLSAQVLANAIMLDIADLTTQLAPQIHPEIPDINEKMSNVTSKILEEKALAAAHNQEYNAKSKLLLDGFAKKQQELRQIQFQEISQLRGQADLDRKTLEMAINKMKSYEDAKTRYEFLLNSLTTQESSHIDKKEKTRLKIEAEAIEIGMVEELKSAVKSYISCSFDDALEAIGDTATRIIRNIPNMANATLQLEGTRETKEGKVKEEVNALISVDGDIGVPIKSLSGGERSAVDLAVDLAVVDLIENKTGKGIDLMILDEPFTGLDAISIEMTLEVLKNSNISKRLIIVDHNDSVKEMVGDRLVVVREGVSSTLLQ